MTRALPPGPPLPAAVQTAAYFARPAAFLEACHRRYGDRFTVRLTGMGSLVYLVDPEEVRAVFRGDPDTFRAGEANEVLSTVLGHRSVLVTDGDPHTAARRRMTPAFRGPALADLRPTMARAAEAEVATWPEHGVVEVLPRMKAVALEIILRTVIGTSEPGRLAELRRVLPPMVDMNASATLALLEPRLERCWPWRRLAGIRADADRVLRDEVARTRRDPDLADRPDILAALVRASPDDRDAVGDDADGELRDQLATLLLAGHETTATGLAWALERLVREPDVLARARDAADVVGADVVGAPGATSAADTGTDRYLEADRYLDAVVTEALRIRPVVPDVVRRLHRPTVVGDRLLPAGTIVAPSIALIQRDPRRHDDPQRFRPERHLRADGTVRPDPLTWLPFGGGVRRCVGAAFATQEMRTVLEAVLRGVDLEPTGAPAEGTRARHVTFAPARGARVAVRRRRPALSPAVAREHSA